MKLNSMYLMSLLFALVGLVFAICAIFNLTKIDTEILLPWALVSLLFALDLQKSEQISELNKKIGVN